MYQEEEEALSCLACARFIAELISVHARMPRDLNPYAQAFVPVRGTTQHAAPLAAYRPDNPPACTTDLLSVAIPRVDVRPLVSGASCGALCVWHPA